MVENYTNTTVNMALYLEGTLKSACEWASPEPVVGGASLRELAAPGLVLVLVLARVHSLQSASPRGSAQLGAVVFKGLSK